MKTWINVKYITELIPEVKFIQELIISGKNNIEMVEALERNTKYKALCYVDKKILRSLNHYKKNKYIFIEGINLNYAYGFKYYGINRKFMFNGARLSTLRNRDEIRHYYNYLKLTSLNNINIFSIGVYRYYKRNWYKLIDYYTKPNQGLYTKIKLR